MGSTRPPQIVEGGSQSVPGPAVAVWVGVTNHSEGKRRVPVEHRSVIRLTSRPDVRTVWLRRPQVIETRLVEFALLFQVLYLLLGLRAVNAGLARSRQHLVDRGALLVLALDILN